MSTQRPEIYTYTNYRAYLEDMHAYLKANERGFSHRRFANRAGLSSPSSFHRVVTGERNLTERSIRAFAKGLKLSAVEQDFFSDLVRMNQAKDPDEREDYYQRMTSRQRYRAAHKLQKDSYDFYSAWYMVPIWELLELDEFREDPNWIAAKLSPNIKPQDAAYALEVISRLGLAERDENGRLRQANAEITTDDEVESILVRNFQQAMIQRALESVVRFDPHVRHASSITAALTEERAEALLAYMHEVRRNIVNFLTEPQDVVNGKKKPKTTVMEITLQAFPVAGEIRNGKEQKEDAN